MTEELLAVGTSRLGSEGRSNSEPQGGGPRRAPQMWTQSNASGSHSQAGPVAAEEAGRLRQQVWSTKESLQCRLEELGLCSQGQRGSKVSEREGHVPGSTFRGSVL